MAISLRSSVVAQAKAVKHLSDRGKEKVKRFVGVAASLEDLDAVEAGSNLHLGLINTHTPPPLPLERKE